MYEWMKGNEGRQVRMAGRRRRREGGNEYALYWSVARSIFPIFQMRH